jgi:hypothetical protein
VGYVRARGIAQVLECLSGIALNSILSTFRKKEYVYAMHNKYIENER